MRENRLWRRRLAGKLLGGVLAVSMVNGWNGNGAGGDKNLSGDELFSGQDIPRIKIEVTPKDIEQLKTRGWSWGWGGATRERPQVQVTVIEGGRVYTNVAMHLKGAAGSFQPIESKPSLTLNFDKFVKGQTFRGLEKISLNNSVQDPSFLCEKTSRELFNAAGIPAPRADYATVELNGRKLGLYVLLEGYNRQFLKRHFKNARGNLYDGGFLKDVDSSLATNSGDARDQSPLRALVAAANEADRTTRFERLQKVLDMDRFITFLAMETLLCHWDGYSMNKNNYRVYHDLDTDRMVFMPHGMDQMFGVMMAQATMPVRPRFQGLVAKAVMDTTDGRRRYFERLSELNRTLFDLEKVTNRVYQSAARIQPVLAELSASAATNHQQDFANLCDRIVIRKQSLEEQLSGARGTILEFDSAGVATLAGWTSQTDYGKALVEQGASVEGKPVLRISAARGHSIGSWRTRVLLEEGQYSFVGRMQTRNVTADQRDRRGGAGLRVSGRPAMQKALGDSDWTPVAFDFEVPDGIHDLELVCELVAATGDAWFDPQSLKLMRK